MKRVVLLLLLLVAFMAQAQQQDSLWVQSEQFYLGAKRVHNLKHIEGYLFRLNDDSLNAAYLDYRKNSASASAVGSVGTVVLVAGFVAGIAVGQCQLDRFLTTKPPCQGEALAYTLLIGGLGVMIASIPLSHRARKRKKEIVLRYSELTAIQPIQSRMYFEGGVRFYLGRR